ncbi:orexin [Trichomycterus rosablanca]|uniref:orexin n=1 Tax=Trichomycterus rosablanca TaxID=2290929 RepID=UPI002F35BD10
MPRGVIRLMDISSVKYSTVVLLKTFNLSCSRQQKLQILLSLVLLAHLICDTEAGSSCCARKPRPCTLYELLCRAGQGNDTGSAGKTGRITSDASAGILTMGKRKENDSRYHDRLQQLLQSSRNQAKGILTVGKRTEDGVATLHRPVKLDLEQPLKYLMQPVDRDLNR